ncbi:MAG TPA: ABC transporter permease [Symbiobacteriaceae bacterium]|nr:ABC transporter permease [Symbiobacteriaceae bacterium]
MNRKVRHSVKSLRELRTAEEGELVTSLKRLLLTILWEALGISLLVGFVLLISTMPPLQITPSTESMTGYAVKVDTRVWKETVTNYYKTVRAGSLGVDRSGNPVGELLRTRMANSLKLMGISLALAVVLGAIKGVRDFNTLRRGRVGLGPVITGLVQGIPDFWLVLLIQVGGVMLYYHWNWRPFPIAWMDDQPVRSMVYPVFCLSLIPMAYVARITSAAMTSVYEKEYVRTARAKGLAEFTVIYGHVVRSALVQILDGLPNALAVMFSNLLIIEYMFHFPGITFLLKDAANPLGATWVDPRFPPPRPDVPVLVATGVTLGLVFALLYFLITIIRPLVDPRLKERESE